LFLLDFSFLDNKKSVLTPPLTPPVIGLDVRLCGGNHKHDRDKRINSTRSGALGRRLAFDNAVTRTQANFARWSFDHCRKHKALVRAQLLAVCCEMGLRFSSNRNPLFIGKKRLAQRIIRRRLPPVLAHDAGRRC